MVMQTSQYSPVTPGLCGFLKSIRFEIEGSIPLKSTHCQTMT
jgi:hypothetical protein